MNTPLRKVALAMMGMIILLLANLTWIQVVDADDYRSDPRNERVLLDEYGRQRGQIIAQGQSLASSVERPESELRFQRTYLNGPLYAPVTGYYSRVYGSNGVEDAMNDVLNGSDGRLFVRRLSDLITNRDPVGGSVALTIDPVVQETAYAELTDAGYTGAVVALRPDTGEILAMVSTPSYDPNELASVDGRAQREAWARFNDPANEVPLTNRATQAIYPPGSTFKLVVSAAALEGGDVTPDTELTAAASIELADTSTELSNFAGRPCGDGDTASLTEALVRSCNTAFAELAVRVGEDRLREQAERLGIGQPDLEVPTPVTPSTIGDIPDDAALQQSAIGQRDVALTPLQDAMIAATIANGGTRMEPQLVREVRAPDLQVVDDFDADEAERAMSEETAEQLRDMMVEAEDSYQGSGDNDLGIAAKTGTAEHGADPKNTPPHTWYVAFAPADDPQVAICVFVEDGGNRSLDATGGSRAAPIGRAVIEAALRGGP